jgi:hypothetical protein
MAFFNVEQEDARQRYVLNFAQALGEPALAIGQCTTAQISPSAFERHETSRPIVRRIQAIAGRSLPQRWQVCRQCWCLD